MQQNDYGMKIYPANKNNLITITSTKLSQATNGSQSTEP